MCVAPMEEKRNAYKDFGRKTWMERNHSKNPSIDENILLD